MVQWRFGFSAQLSGTDSAGNSGRDACREGAEGGAPREGGASDDAEPPPGGGERVSPPHSGPAVHPAAAQLIEEVRASGEFTEETWRRLSGAMDDLSDADLAAVLEEIGRSAVHRPKR